MSDDAARSGQGGTPWSPPEPQPQAPATPPGGAPQAYSQPGYPQAPYGQAPQQPGAFPPPPQAQPAGVPVKMSSPWTFSGAIGLIGLALVCALGNAVLVLAKGRDMLGDVVDEILPGASSDVREFAIDEAYDTLSGRAGISIFFGVVVIGFAIPMLFRFNWSRIVVTCVFPILLLVSLRNVTDDIPGVMRALEGIALASGLVFIVLIWLGPSNRYIRARKQAAAPTMPQPPYPGWA